MKLTKPKAVKLSDYKVSDYLIDKVHLKFELNEKKTYVIATSELHRNPESSNSKASLYLNGYELTPEFIKIDGVALESSDYTLDKAGVTLHNVPEQFSLSIKTSSQPQKNTALEGLYKSNNIFCTQCEAEGFRRITYYLDRPDVMAQFDVEIEADKTLYPVLLSNGNLVASKDLPNGRHSVHWRDPHKKPCYLFALVAGDLSCNEETMKTKSGNDVLMQIYTEPENADKCAHALRSLKRSIEWDEKVYNLEYDLDRYMIVAINDFNMGAMENKGLNIFNSKYILATDTTATDDDFIAIESVIGHEYFHNWTGNRVTCRDWFQLSLKEGLTVFRDQSFTADMTEKKTKRIRDVRMLREQQFPEDNGPMAHPVRPDKYLEINNFYTVTVYEKGSELVRMYETLLGKRGFQAGMKLYFERHDGSAVTTDDFLDAMQDANNIDLTQFKTWYDRPGTPLVSVEGDWNKAKKTYTLNLSQSMVSSDFTMKNKPFLIPIKLGLLSQDGDAMDLYVTADSEPVQELTLNLSKTKQSVTLHKVEENPIPSLLRGFSAPVELKFKYDHESLAILTGHDVDSFNRWEAAQQLATRAILDCAVHVDTDDYRRFQVSDAIEHWLRTVNVLLKCEDIDKGLLAEVMELPNLGYLGEKVEVIDATRLHYARLCIQQQMAENNEYIWRANYKQLKHLNDKGWDPDVIGDRRLKNLALFHLVKLGKDEYDQWAWQQFVEANNMTDVMAAMRAIVLNGRPRQQEALDKFADDWQQNTLVMDKWFILQAMICDEHALSRVKQLMNHPLFSNRNPNKVRALIGAFAQRNPIGFHSDDGSGYKFLAKQIITIDKLNPQVAARLAGVFTHWHRHNYRPGEQMHEALRSIYTQKDYLSKDVLEIVGKSLGSDF